MIWAAFLLPGENMQIFLDTTATSPAGQISYEKVSDDFLRKIVMLIALDL